ncbi:MAG: hypothetical protein GSR85_11310 [Desulfurococcales archaeon]|nr:hypothetical protein [Desulfurococcales archaeon]
MASSYLSSEGSRFLLAGLTPITLASVASNNDLDEALELVKSPYELAKRILKGLEEKLLEDYKSSCAFIRNDNMVSESAFRLIIDTDNIVAQSNCSKQILPQIFHAPAEIVKCDVNECNKHVSSGHISLALIPLTGTIKICNKLLIFREKSRDDVKAFGNAVLATIANSLRNIIHYSLDALHPRETSSKSEEELYFLVDTTHGINNITSLMLQAIVELEPLIFFEAKRVYSGNINILYYNSDPALGLPPDPLKSLKETKDQNISYYYIMRGNSTSEFNIKYKLRDFIKKHILKDSHCRDQDEKCDTILTYIGIYLLQLGLIPWGLYDIEVGDIKEPQPIIENKYTDTKINYKVINREDPYLHESMYWLASLVKKAVSEVIEQCGGSAENNCLRYTAFSKASIRCFPSHLLKSLSNESHQESSCRGWALELLRSIIEPSARMIFSYELDQWMEPGKIVKRLSYLAADSLVPSTVDHKTCDRVIGGIKVDEDFCITPMRLQSNVRNIIAHGGLTGVTHGMVFIFRDYSQKCRLHSICIASPFPEEFIKELLE